MKNDEVTIGIDISKSTLDLIGIIQDGEVSIAHNQIENTRSSITKFIKTLLMEYEKNSIMICFEDTGVYNMNLELELGSEGIAYSKVPALEIHLSKGIS